MKTTIVISTLLLILIGESAKAQNSSYGNIVQVNPPPQVQAAYEDWIANSPLAQFFASTQLYQPLNRFWKISSKEFNSPNGLIRSSYFIVPVLNYPNLCSCTPPQPGPTPYPLLSLIIISASGDYVDFIYHHSFGLPTSLLNEVKIIGNN